MNLILKVGITLVITALVNLSVQSRFAHADPNIPESVPSLGLALRENSDLGRLPSAFWAFQTAGGLTTVCNNLYEKECSESLGIYAIINWDICNDNSSVACIANFWAKDQNGKKINGEFIKSVPKDSRYIVQEDANLKIPGSNGIGGVWRLPGVINSSGRDTYFVAAQSSFNYTKKTGVEFKENTFKSGKLVVGVMPIEELNGPYQLITAGGPNCRSICGPGTRYASDGSPCASTEVNYCEAIRQFPSNFRFGVTIRIADKTQGWFHGRLFLPEISTAPWKTGSEISIEAEPVKVPSLDFSVPNSEIPQEIRSYVFSDRIFGHMGLANTGIKIVTKLSDPSALELVSRFVPAYKNKATTTETYWSFQTLLYDNSNLVKQCTDKSGDFAGIVTTNALAYSGGPPTFDADNATLSYKVASPHYEANGNEAIGTYDLLVRSDVARCIYGFSTAPIKAEISITNQTGVQRIETTSFSERDGWLSLSANGFGYSSPVINVKLYQDSKIAEVNPSSSPVPIEISAPQKKDEPTSKNKLNRKSSIICQKGKLTKKVSAVNPKCPAGYKKK